MHISHCSWPNPFLRKGKNDSAKHCSRLPSWVHQVQRGRVLAWLQSKQNWPFLRLYLPLILLHLFFPLRGIHGVFPGRGGLLLRYQVKVSVGLMATHGVFQPMVEHASEGGAPRCITYQSSCRGRLTQREGENITRNDQNMQMITSSRTTLISFFPSQSLAGRPDHTCLDRSREETSLQGNTRACAKNGRILWPLIS